MLSINISELIKSLSDHVDLLTWLWLFGFTWMIPDLTSRPAGSHFNSHGGIRGGRTCLCVCWPYSGVVLQELCELLNTFSLYGASQQSLCVCVNEEGWDGTQQRAHAQGAQTVIVRVTWGNTESDRRKETEFQKKFKRIVSHLALCQHSN